MRRESQASAAAADPPTTAEQAAIRMSELLERHVDVTSDPAAAERNPLPLAYVLGEAANLYPRVPEHNHPPARLNSQDDS